MVDSAREAKFKWQDACAAVSIILAVAMSGAPIFLRLICFAACAVFLPISFLSHKNWPSAIRWIGSLLTIALMTYLGWDAWQTRPKPIREVFLEWRQPAPIDLGVPLSERQLNAVAKYNGVEVPGHYLYSPTLGATLPFGMDSIAVEFTPKDPLLFRPAKSAIVIFVANPDVKQAKQIGRPSNGLPKPNKLPKQGFELTGDVTQTNTGDCIANTVNGDSKVENSCNTMPVARHLTAAQKSAISASLNGKNLTVEFLSLVNVADAQEFSTELCEAFKESIDSISCQDVSLVQSQNGKNPLVGINIVRKKSNKLPSGREFLPFESPEGIAASAIMAAHLGQGGTIIDPSLPEGKIEVIVGSPPPPPPAAKQPK